MSIKGLKKRPGHTYRECFEGWNLDYGFDADGGFFFHVGRGHSRLMSGYKVRTLAIARAAAKAGVMAHESRGLVSSGSSPVMNDGFAGFMKNSEGTWFWYRRDTIASGNAKKLGDARRAARRAAPSVN